MRGVRHIFNSTLDPTTQNSQKYWIIKDLLCDLTSFCPTPADAYVFVFGLIAGLYLCNMYCISVKLIYIL